MRTQTHLLSDHLADQLWSIPAHTHALDQTDRHSLSLHLHWSDAKPHMPLTEADTQRPIQARALPVRSADYFKGKGLLSSMDTPIMLHAMVTVCTCTHARPWAHIQAWYCTSHV